MKKTKYIYKHTIYGGGPNGFNDGEVRSFFEVSGIKLHGSKKDDYFYSWEYAGDQCSWFTFSYKEEVEVSAKVTKLESKISKSRPRKSKKLTKLPINPKTGLRDGGV